MTTVNENWTPIPNPQSGQILPDSFENYAACPSSMPEGSVRMWSVTLNGKDSFKLGPVADNGRNPTIQDLFRSAKNLYQNDAYNLICRSAVTDATGTYQIWVNRSFPGFLPCPDNNPNVYTNKAPTELLTEQEAAYLESKYSVWGLDPQTGCRQSGGGKTVKLYLYNNPIIVDGIIDAIRNDIENESLPSYLDEDRAEKIIEMLVGVEEQNPGWAAEQTRELLEGQSYDKILDRALMILIGAGILYHPISDIISRIRGRVKTTDYGEFIRKQIAADPRYSVRGRTQEAIQAWKMTDTPKFRNILIIAPTGEGKDELVKEMIIMKERGSLAVPARFRQAPVYKITGADFRSKTSLRGQLADKVTEMGDKARKGPVIYVLPEIDVFFKGARLGNEDPEDPAKMMLDMMDEDIIKENLVVIGTSSRGDEMLSEQNNLLRRFNRAPFHNYNLSEVIDIIDNGWTKIYLQKRYNIRIPSEVVDAAARLAEQYYRSAKSITDPHTGEIFPNPRFDSVTDILIDAVKIAKERGAAEVTVEDAIAATEQRIGAPLNREWLEITLTSPIDTIELNYQATGQSQPDTPDAQVEQVVAELKSVPVLKSLTLGLSEGELKDFARDLHMDWTSLSLGERAALITEMNLFGKNEGPIPVRWIVERTQTLARERAEAELRAEDKESKEAKEKKGVEDKPEMPHLTGTEGTSGK